MVFLFTTDVDLFLVLLTRREVGGERRVSFPSDALLTLRKVDFTLDVSLGGCLGIVAPVRRWEDAEGDRDAGVKVQVDDLSGRELFSNAFRRARKEDKKGTLASGKEGGERANAS